MGDVGKLVGSSEGQVTDPEPYGHEQDEHAIFIQLMAIEYETTWYFYLLANNERSHESTKPDTR
jgi:hypothetical protein